MSAEDPILHFRQSDRDRILQLRYWLIGLTCLELSQPFWHQGATFALGLVAGFP